MPRPRRRVLGLLGSVLASCAAGTLPSASRLPRNKTLRVWFRVHVDVSNVPEDEKAREMAVLFLWQKLVGNYLENPPHGMQSIFQRFVSAWIEKTESIS